MVLSWGSLFFIAFCAHLPNSKLNHPKLNKWEIVTDPQGKYGFVDWNGEVEGEYKTCDEARAAMVEAKKWSDNYDADWEKKHTPGFYKAVDVNAANSR